tara:strand:- start:3000 stop:3293 length:294 start_codon:yes stop_codon:yes gene_type:complete
MKNDDLNIIFDIKKKQKKIKKEINKKIFIQCKNTIILHAKNNKTECFFKIPFFIFGLPKYDVKYVSDYIIYKLNKFSIKKVLFFEPNIIYIDWSDLS